MFVLAGGARAPLLMASATIARSPLERRAANNSFHRLAVAGSSLVRMRHIYRLGQLGEVLRLGVSLGSPVNTSTPASSPPPNPHPARHT